MGVAASTLIVLNGVLTQFKMAALKPRVDTNEAGHLIAVHNFPSPIRLQLVNDDS